MALFIVIINVYLGIKEFYVGVSFVCSSFADVCAVH